MKRGWITWDKLELPPSAFEARLNIIRESMAELDLPAVLVYTDVWKSNAARHFANYMPYWNRALLVIPRETAPILICGLSPRVYPWIKSVTTLEEIRPGANLPQQLLQLCTEKSWTRLGALDLPQLPYDLYSPVTAGVETADLPSSALHLDTPDEYEAAMYRSAAGMAREILEDELRESGEGVDYHLAGRLERKFRRAGVEELVIRIANGGTPPRPAHGSALGTTFSVAIAVEYRGHWVKIARPRATAEALASIHERFQTAIAKLDGSADGIVVENLSGPYPYEAQDPRRLPPGAIFSVHVEASFDGARLFYGDTLRRTEDLSIAPL